MCKNRHNQSGSVLIIVVAVISALALLGIALVVITSSKARETKTYMHLKKARIAAHSALNYCYDAFFKIANEHGIWISPSCENVSEAVKEFNEHLFGEGDTTSCFYYLKDRNDFPHDAFDITQDYRAVIGRYAFPKEGVCGDNVLNPVGAVYTCEFVPPGFDITAFQDVDAGGGNSTVSYEPNSEGATARIKLYGWGRVFDRVGKEYVPICEDAFTTTLYIRVLSITAKPDEDSETPHKIYEFSNLQGTLSDVERVQIGKEDNWPAYEWRGNTWFTSNVVFQ